jgi:hypothetical protein
MQCLRPTLAGLIPALVISSATWLHAQDAPTAASQSPDHSQMNMSSGSWMWMTDGTIFVTFNEQGGARGERELKSQNWFMVMGTHRLGRGELTLTGMFSAEPATTTLRGYSELFQMGEAYQQLENIDRQHPHDLFSQLAAIWQVRASAYRLSFAAAPMGEATLGPVVFMHRSSASENPTSPLGHHTLDSTHVVQGVVAGAIDRGPVTLEGSWFRGREPDEHRADIDLGALDSWAARVWYRPSSAWSIQVSHGFLKEPEQLEPGDIRRTTASVSWQLGRDDNELAMSAMVGHNKRTYTDLTAFVSELTLHRNRFFAYGRYEQVEVETEHLLFPTVVHKPHPGELIDLMGAVTAGGGLEIGRYAGMEFGLGADLTFYAVPARLVADYGQHPLSSHVFLRVRLPTGSMGRMRDMTMIPH